jgi:hypothetical protein
VAQKTSHPPLEQKTRVRIPPEDKVFREMLLSKTDLSCIGFVFNWEICKGFGHKIFFDVMYSPNFNLYSCYLTKVGLENWQKKFDMDPNVDLLFRFECF